VSVFIGIDTSNYTSSVAAYDSKSEKMISEKLLLPVKENERGLRQSDAVFLHVRQLGQLVEKVISQLDDVPAAIGVSVSPCDNEGSYMPCFLVGKMLGQALSAAYGVKMYSFSHQRGHIAAALFSADCTYLFDKPFLALHISGGTTDLLKVQPDINKILSVSCIGKSLDLKAGQVIDRIGVMLGLRFPCGPELEKLSHKSDKRFKIIPSVKGMDCALSGIENKAKKMIDNGESKEDIAKFCLDYIQVTIDKMCDAAHKQHPDLPFVFAGGVMSNQKIKTFLANKYNGNFAEPKYSSDNAAGIALLCKIAHQINLSE